ncbi:hypothetical protein DTL42_10870 [Bremerella cremea]|uniref:Uncharacterized protein n=1 Tax=Bremerella cremea TaxID=1031537 RepID=A0A368KUN1_9BACT|nr:hypothetical protein DTL42_10870 [Bremerella cremea]
MVSLLDGEVVDAGRGELKVSQISAVGDAEIQKGSNTRLGSLRVTEECCVWATWLFSGFVRETSPRREMMSVLAN